MEKTDDAEFPNIRRYRFCSTRPKLWPASHRSAMNRKGSETIMKVCVSCRGPAPACARANESHDNTVRFRSLCHSRPCKSLTRSRTSQHPVRANRPPCRATLKTLTKIKPALDCSRLPAETATVAHSKTAFTKKLSNNACKLDLCSDQTTRLLQIGKPLLNSDDYALRSRSTRSQWQG